MPWVNISTLDRSGQTAVTYNHFFEETLLFPVYLSLSAFWALPVEPYLLLRHYLAAVIFFFKMSSYSSWHLEFYIWEHRQCSLEVIEFYQIYCFTPSALAEVVIITSYCSTIVRGLRVMKYSWAQPVYIKTRFEQLKITQPFLPSWKHTVGVLLKCIKPMH